MRVAYVCDTYTHAGVCVGLHIMSKLPHTETTHAVSKDRQWSISTSPPPPPPPHPSSGRRWVSLGSSVLDVNKPRAGCLCSSYLKY